MERKDIPGPVGPDGTNPDSFNDPRFPKVVDRTKPIDPDTLALMRLDWEGPIRSR